jgi:hypothetical protein
MTRWAVIVLAACAISGCGSDDNTGPSTAPIVFTAALAPSNEVPAVSGPESAGHGTAQIEFDVVRNSSGVITSATASMYFQLSGYPAGTTIVGAHIHPAPAGVTGPVILGTPLAGSNTRVLANGTGEFTFSGLLADPVLVQSIVNNPSGYYFNVHSPANPGGFSRGQLTRIQ